MSEMESSQRQRIQQICAEGDLVIREVSRVGTVLVLKASRELDLPDSGFLQAMVERVKEVTPEVRYVTLELEDSLEE